MSDIRKWEDFAANPEAFGKSEKELWVKLEPILQRLFDELKANGKIETVYSAEQFKIMENLEFLIGAEITTVANRLQQKILEQYHPRYMSLQPR